MSIAEIIFGTLIGGGILIFIFYLLRDPIVNIKFILRMLKPDRIERQIVFFPIWGTIWIIDKVFKFHIYSDNLIDSSRKVQIDFADYEKFIALDTIENSAISELITSFILDAFLYEPEYSLEQTEIYVARQQQKILLKFEKEIDFNSFHALLRFFDTSLIGKSNQTCKGILLHTSNSALSYYCFVRGTETGSLVGRSKKSKRLFLQFTEDKYEVPTLYFNRNIDFVKSFNFRKFESDLIRFRFHKLELDCEKIQLEISKIMYKKVNIISSPERKLIGKQLCMSLAQNKTAQLWQSFMPDIRQIANRVNQDKISLALYPKDYFDAFKPQQEFVKWAAVEVSSFEQIPENMETLVIPTGLYAVFQYKGLSSDNSIFQYIFGEWLPASEYELDNRPHFEILGSKYQNNHPNSEEEIWIPVVDVEMR